MRQDVDGNNNECSTTMIDLDSLLSVLLTIVLAISQNVFKYLHFEPRDVVPFKKRDYSFRLIASASHSHSHSLRLAVQSSFALIISLPLLITVVAVR